MGQNESSAASGKSRPVVSAAQMKHSSQANSITSSVISNKPSQVVGQPLQQAVAAAVMPQNKSMITSGVRSENPEYKQAEKLETNSLSNCSVLQDKLTTSRLQMKKNREEEMSKLVESNLSHQKQIGQEGLSQLLAVLEKNQSELIEIIDERVQMITSDFEEKLLAVENKVDTISERLLDFQQHFEENSLVDSEKVNQNVREGIDSLRAEIKAIVALSEKYIKDDNKIQSISLLSKTIAKENKHPKRSHEYNPYYEKRERSKLEKQIQDSSILREYGTSITNVSPYFQPQNNQFNSYAHPIQPMQLSQFFNPSEVQDNQFEPHVGSSLLLD